MRPAGLLRTLPIALSIALATFVPSALPAVSDVAIELRNRGLALLENEKEGDAEAVYRQLIDESPDDPLGYANLAIALLRQQKMEEASARIGQALQLAPDRPDLLAIRGAVLVWSDEREAALEALQIAARARPDDLETLYAVYQHASSMRGPEAAEAERWAIERLYELRPENLVSLLKLGRSALDREDRATASTVYLRIRELLWQAPPVASEQLELLLQALEDGDLERGRRPSIILDNVLRAEIMYQRGLDELRTNIPGIPVASFVDEPAPTTFGEPVAVRFRATRVEGAAATYSRAMTIEDFDGDGLPDIARVVTTDGGTALEIRLAKDDWQPGSLDSAPLVSKLVAFDLNNDGALDLLGVGGGVAFWLGSGDGKFTESADALGFGSRSLTAGTPVDFDIEGDLDLVTASADGLELYRNTLEGALSPVGDRSLPALELGEVHDILASDLDRDGDLDLLIAHDDGLTFLRNLRQGRFSEATEQVGLATSGPITDVLSADLDSDGWPDLVTTGSQIAAWRNVGGHFVAWQLEGDLPLRVSDDSAPGYIAPGYSALEAFDADNDGRLDLLVTVGGTSGNSTVEIFTQAGATPPRGATPSRGAYFLRASVESPPSGISTARAADLDGDGDLDIVASGPGGLYRLENIGGNQNHWIDVSLRGLTIGDGKNNLFGQGATVELFLGDAYQFREVTATTTHFGLGQHGCPDVMRVVWTNGVPQNRICAEIDQLVVEEQILKGSCPFLYAWDGESVGFVTDLLWGGPLGMPIGEGQWAGADPHELVEVAAARPIDGVYDLRITEELWEAAYFDLARLWVVDHP
ncbi:MAG: FG-GAP-like repeat-containing protein, partial [Acidobacteria bacterium]|nr:FG-GAP-like repeat-containing protein [Acidobacteriota bacterium]